MKEEEEFKAIGSSSKCVRLLCSSDDVLNHILSEVRGIKTCMSSRLTSLELKMSVLIQTCNKISSRLDAIEKNELKINGMENENSSLDQSDKSNEAHSKDETVSSKLKIVPLSSEADYPNGTWLGNPKSLTNRVRCNISPQTLFHINSTCFTPEKMALCLLDNLFAKDELAISNISGRSRWGKKQLSPLLIYGIKAHLKHKFFIGDKDWHKICQNMDAKCRFAGKRRQRINSGQSKAKLKTPIRGVQVKGKSALEPRSASEEIGFDFETLNHSNMDFNSCVKVITESPCELRILNATPAQIAHLQESQEIILAEEMLPHSNEDVKPIMINSSSEVSMNTVVMDGVVDPLAIEEEQDSNHSSSLLCSKDGRTPPPNNHQETLTIHDSQLEEGLQLEVELDHEAQVEEDYEDEEDAGV